jgi:hypothetical protein
VALIDLIAAHASPWGFLLAAGGAYVAWKNGKDLGVVPSPEQGPIVESVPPMGCIDEQRSDRTWGERFVRLFDSNADGPNQPIRGITKDEHRAPKQEPKQSKTDIVKPISDVRFPAPQDMAMIIERGFKPRRDAILLMNTVNGYATEKISKLHHIGLSGASGRGKTGVMRLIVSQLLACEARVYMVNPNFAPVKHNGNRMEDWRPIAARLQKPVARNAPEIEELLNYFMQIFKQRREREQVTPKRGADLFLVLGEWPVIVEEYPEAEKIIGRLLRQARQYGIHIIAEFQDALISTIKGSGGTRANYGTAYFFGGDLTTAKTLLSLPDGVKIDNTGLGHMGAVYLKSFSVAAAPGRVPFFSNKALYMLLGCIGEPVADEEVDEDEFYEDDEDEEDIDAVFARMPDVRDDDDDEYPVRPIVPEEGKRAEDIDPDLAVLVWNAGQNTVSKLMKTFKLTNHQAQKLRKIILEQANANPEEGN